MADRIQAEMHRLSAIGVALAATVEQGDMGYEKRFVDGMIRVFQEEPEILGQWIAFEPNTFHPILDSTTRREPPLWLPLGLEQVDPYRDGYSLYVRRNRLGAPGISVEEVKRSYCYREQPWYVETLLERSQGWEEPSYDSYGEMVSCTTRLRRARTHQPIGVLCVDLRFS